MSPEEYPDMPQYVLHMVTEVVNVKDIDLHKMMEFILTVRKCYRNNHYHNFEHAFNVAHCMYNILWRNLEKFSNLEVIIFHLV